MEVPSKKQIILELHLAIYAVFRLIQLPDIINEKRRFL